MPVETSFFAATLSSFIDCIVFHTSSGVGIFGVSPTILFADSVIFSPASDFATTFKSDGSSTFRDHVLMILAILLAPAMGPTPATSAAITSRALG